MKGTCVLKSSECINAQGVMQRMHTEEDANLNIGKGLLVVPAQGIEFKF